MRRPSAGRAPDPGSPRACRAVQVTEKARHYGYTTLLPAAVDPAEDLVLQFDLKLASGLR